MGMFAYNASEDSPNITYFFCTLLRFFSSFSGPDGLGYDGLVKDVVRRIEVQVSGTCEMILLTSVPGHFNHAWILFP